MLDFVRGGGEKRPPRPFAADIEDAGFAAELDAVRGAVRREIADINDAMQWTEALFEPLDAEVEVQRPDGPQREVRDLMTAIRGDRLSRTFLVLGEPGSGKSVALRKLTLDLMDEAPATGRLPFYINLKECRADWKAGPAASISLYNFALEHLREHYNVVVTRFLDQYFERLYHTGHLFLILDSFDEIPAILDATEHSDELRDISRAVFELIQAPGPTQGVIASRYFKKPMLVGQTVTTLDIRPFTETKIRGALERTHRFPAKTLDTLFTERPDLVSVAQNPFSATMLARYVQKHDALPDTQSDLFAATISDRIHEAADWLRRAALARSDLEAGATAIAVTMFTRPDIGLDATVAELAGTEVPGGSIENITNALTYAKIGHFSPGPERRFSFVHRRFNEYFLVQRLLLDPSLASLEAIPTDNRWRDALTLYCEVTTEAEAIRIAEFCWRHVRRLNDPTPLTDEERFAAVQCLRFLRDAFSHRLAAIEHIRGDLAATVIGVLDRELAMKRHHDYFDVILVKLVVEVVGLLPQREIEVALQLALKLDHGWISQVALRSCRSLRRIDREIEAGLARTIISIPSEELSRRYQELFFSLSISDAFGRLRALLTKRHQSERRLRRAMPLLVALGPTATLLAWLASLVAELWDSHRPAWSRRYSVLGRFHSVWGRDDQLMFRVVFLGALVLPFVTNAIVLPIRGVGALFGVTRGNFTGEDMITLGSTQTVAPFVKLAGLLPANADVTIMGASFGVNASLCLWLALAIVAVPTMVPWYAALHARMVMPGFVSGLPRGALKYLMIVVASIGLVALVGSAFLLFIELLQRYAPPFLLRYGLFLVWGVLGLAYGWFALQSSPGLWSVIKSYRQDRRRVLSLVVPERISRETIAQDFAAYATQKYRLLYIRRLISHHPVVYGAWPRGIFPGSSNDAASIMLAQWEERLQRLD